MSVKTNIARMPQWQILLTILLMIFMFAITTYPVKASVHSDLKDLALVIEQAVDRLDSGIELTPVKSDEFLRQASLQFELAALAMNKKQLLEEDFYHLGLSLIARHFLHYDLAAELLQCELAKPDSMFIRDWLRKEIAELQNLERFHKTTKNPQSSCKIQPALHRSYQNILNELSLKLRKKGVH